MMINPIKKSETRKISWTSREIMSAFLVSLQHVNNFTSISDMTDLLPSRSNTTTFKCILPTGQKENMNGWLYGSYVCKTHYIYLKKTNSILVYIIPLLCMCGPKTKTPIKMHQI